MVQNLFNIIWEQQINHSVLDLLVELYVELLPDMDMTRKQCNVIYPEYKWFYNVNTSTQVTHC